MAFSRLSLLPAALHLLLCAQYAHSAAIPRQVADFTVVRPRDDASSASAECAGTITITITPSATIAASATAAASTTAAAASSTAAASSIGNFGSCSIPQIEFGVGFDNRKETSFQPVDKTSYNHGSAQNIDIITQFMCDALVNTCGADQTAKNTCATAKAAADTVTAKTGGQADAFNAVFGITTDFAAIAEVDDQGNVVSGTGSSSAVASAAASSSAASAVATAASSSATAASAAASSSSSSGAGNFGSCSVPQIAFGAGFDGRKETSFEPADKTSFNHGSAQNIDIISQFICGQLSSACGADQTAQTTCATASAAADAQPAGTGAQADAFNAAFGITTDFAAVAEVDDQGNVVAGSTSGAVASAAAPSPATSAAAAATSSAVAATSAAAPAATLAATGGNLQTFTDALGGVNPPAVTALSNGQFQVDGNSAFNSLQSALQRSCDVQNNQCADAANASGNKGGLTVAACNAQQSQCNAQVQA
ncbi:hypothetical protein CERSUDRAFT_118084 [Gelatoporia subvermispora B]|uniref:Uncharacterized protein n=1 Tax=Ceriporiopsis subvermispora (strain B) TaxID=914234 RepID=M2Q9H9_CERS8|nr:hypothetical protein CERSUDRAFT_118084 [Gelatoporia subvermispora B]